MKEGRKRGGSALLYRALLQVLLLTCRMWEEEKKGSSSRWSTINNEERRMRKFGTAGLSGGSLRAFPEREGCESAADEKQTISLMSEARRSRVVAQKGLSERKGFPHQV